MRRRRCYGNSACLKCYELLNCAELEDLPILRRMAEEKGKPAVGLKVFVRRSGLCSLVCILEHEKLSDLLKCSSEVALNTDQLRDA